MRLIDIISNIRKRMNLSRRHLSSLITSILLMAPACMAANNGGASKTLHFPTSMSLGRLYLMGDDCPAWGNLRERTAEEICRHDRFIKRASGLVQLPKRDKLMLQVGYGAAHNLSNLTANGPDAFAGLDLTFVGAEPKLLPKIAQLTGLEVLRANYSKVSDQGLAVLSTLKNLKYLALAHGPITGQGLQNILPLPSLKYLDLEESKVGDEGLTALKKCHHLQAVVLAGSGISDAGLASMATNLPELREINLDANRITASGLLQLSGMKKLEYLSVCGTDVTANDLPTIEKLVHTWPAFKTLKVSHKSFTDASIAPWKNAFPHGEIELPRILHFPDGITLGLLRILRPAGAAGARLVGKDLGQAHGSVAVPAKVDLLLEPSYDAARDLSCLAKYRGNVFAGLGCRHVDIDDAAFAKLSVLTDLKQLDLRESDVTDEGLKSLAKIANLEDLDLSYSSNFGDGGITSIAQLKSLHALTLNHTRVGNRALQLLTKSENLRELAVGNSAVTDDGLKSLASNKKLRVLRLSDNSKITAKGLLNLLPLKELEDLEIEYTAITINDLPTLQKLAQNIPTLTWISLGGKGFTGAIMHDWQEALPVNLRFMQNRDPSHFHEDANTLFAPTHF